MDFRKHLPAFTEPMPNLRWVPVPAFNPRPDKQDDASLVTPYGPCVDLIGNAAGTGYVVMKWNGGTTAQLGKAEFLGGYDATRSAATESAEKYCHNWYTAETSKPQGAERPMWFTPDPEEVSAAQPAATGSSPEVDEDPVSSSGEVPPATETQDQNPSGEDSNRSPAPSNPNC